MSAAFRDSSIRVSSVTAGRLPSVLGLTSGPPIGYS